MAASVPDVLVSTKLFLPPPPPTAVLRPRLLERLDGGVARGRLTLVAAPAGFGKTTLLSAWLMGSERPVAWLSLDEGDDDPLRFLRHAVAALERLGVDLDDAAALLRREPSTAPERVAAAVVNAFAHAPSAGGLFVLDDVHAVRSEAVHGLLRFWLEHLPPGVHLVVASRSDPPLGLARLRGMGALTEIRAAELRFRHDEARSFLVERMGLELPDELVARLEARTEGWIVGLQLAALSLRDEGDPAAFVGAFAGDDRFVLDYLLDEVFARQTAEVQAFLLRTALLERMSAPLCAAVLERSEGECQARLEALERANLFVDALDSKRRWYRYHRLFADLLAHRLNHLLPDEVPALHRRAAGWLERAGAEDEALRHLLAGGAFDAAADLLERAGTAALWQRGEVMGLRGRLARLPADLVARRPRLTLLDAWIHHTVGDVAALAERLEQAERALSDESRAPVPAADASADTRALRGELATLQGLLVRARGAADSDPERARAHFRAALERLPADALQLRSRTLIGLGETQVLGDDLAAAENTFERASTLGVRGTNPAAALYSLWWVADIQIARAELGAALATCERMRRLRETHAPRFDGVRLADIQRARVLCERDDADAAVATLRDALAGVDPTPNPRVFLVAHLTLARARQAAGDEEGARAALERAAEIEEARGAGWSWTFASVAAIRARVDLMQGRLAAAAAWANRVEAGADGLPAAARAALARVLLATGRVDDAGALLERLRGDAERADRWGRVLECDVLLALAHRQRGDAEASRRCLSAAFRRAEPEGYARLFLDEGDAMLELLANAAAASPYAARLLARGRAAAPTAVPVANGEAFNERELTVLRLMAGRLSNKEIARELELSVNTVKWYARAIYEKLGVHSRRNAVARGRDLGLL